MRSTVKHNGETFDAEVFEYDHHGWPISWAVYNQRGEDFSESLTWQEQERIAAQLMLTAEEQRNETAFEKYKEI